MQIVLIFCEKRRSEVHIQYSPEQKAVILDLFYVQNMDFKSIQNIYPAFVRQNLARWKKKAEEEDPATHFTDYYRNLDSEIAFRHDGGGRKFSRINKCVYPLLDVEMTRLDVIGANTSASNMSRKYRKIAYENGFTISEFPYEVQENKMHNFITWGGWREKSINEQNKGGSEEIKYTKLSYYGHGLAWNNLLDTVKMRESWKEMQQNDTLEDIEGDNFTNVLEVLNLEECVSNKMGTEVNKYINSLEHKCWPRNLTEEEVVKLPRDEREKKIKELQEVLLQSDIYGEKLYPEMTKDMHELTMFTLSVGLDRTAEFDHSGILTGTSGKRRRLTRQKNRVKIIQSGSPKSAITFY
jgi:hypothetical protein